MSDLLKRIAQAVKSYPQIGDTILSLGHPCKVIDFGQWPVMAEKYPEAASKWFNADTDTSKFGRTWVLRSPKGEIWMIGSKGLDYLKAMESAYPQDKAIPLQSP